MENDADILSRLQTQGGDDYATRIVELYETIEMTMSQLADAEGGGVISCASTTGGTSPIGC